MPTFDVVSQVDMQEVRNAVDQANREAGTRFDFKGTDSSIELGEDDMVLRSSTEDRLRALHQVLQEKLVRREVSLKALEDGKIEEATKGTVRQRIAIKAGISADHAKRMNKFVKDLNLKGISSQAQGDQLRVTGKKRDDLQAAIQALKEHDFGIPLQFHQLPGLTELHRGTRVQRRAHTSSSLHRPLSGFGPLHLHGGLHEHLGVGVAPSGPRGRGC